MRRETITISIGPDMKKFILRRASTDFKSVSDYIRSLVLRDNYRERELKKIRDQDAARTSPQALVSWGQALSRRP